MISPLLKELELETKALENLVAKKALSGFKIEKRFESSLLGRNSPACVSLSRQEDRYKITINLNETGYPEEDQEGEEEEEEDQETVEEAQVKQSQQAEEEKQGEDNEQDEEYEDEGNSSVTQFNARLELLDEKGQAVETLQLLGDLDLEQKDYAIHTIITNQNGTGLDVEALPEKLRDQVHKYFEQFGINSHLVEIYDKLSTFTEEEDAGQHDISNLAGLQDLSKFITNLNAAKRKN